MFKSLKWRQLKSELLCNFGVTSDVLDQLGYYGIVYLLIDEKGEPLRLYPDNENQGHFCVFTEENGPSKLSKCLEIDEIKNTFSKPYGESSFSKEYRTKKLMVGHLMELLRDQGSPQAIKVNPIWAWVNGQKVLLSEEILIAPIFDKITKKYLISDPSDAIALLAVSPEEQKRFGIELTFYMITNRDLPDDMDSRSIELTDRIDGLSFMIPRVPQKMGSGTFFVTIINLDNPLEEMAFIRNYPLLDKHASCLFVTSDFKMRSGNLQEIHYDGEQIDTIFMPMIDWQKTIRT